KNSRKLFDNKCQSLLEVAKTDTYTSGKAFSTQLTSEEKHAKTFSDGMWGSVTRLHLVHTLKLAQHSWHEIATKAISLS
ncbi:uncharacterized protein PHACADRAFT_99266, partial [Phanerochaete carnosa HHB-10118-sp]